MASNSSGPLVAPLLMSNSTRSAKRSSSPGWRTASLTGLPFGTTSAPSTGDPGVDSWMACLRASRASHSPPLESGKATLTPGTSGQTSGASSASPNPQLSFWKMCLARCRISTMSSCPSYRDWVTPLRSDSLRRLKLARHTGGSGSSLWPTKSAENYGTNVVGAAGRVGIVRPSLETLSSQWMTPQARDHKDGATREFPETLKGTIPLGRQAPRSGIGGPPSSPDGPSLPRPPEHR